MAGTDTRFAISWVPATGSLLHERSTAWSGWCAETARSGLSHSLDGARYSAAEVRRTGVHAPLVQPFRLPSSVSKWHLQRELSDLGNVSTEIGPIHFVIRPCHGGFAIVPSWPFPAWSALATQLSVAVHRFAPSAQPVSAPDMAMVLTDQLPPEMAARAKAAAVRHFAPALRNIMILSEIAILECEADSRTWRVLDRFALSGALRESSTPPALACQGPSLLAPLGCQLAS